MILAAFCKMPLAVLEFLMTCMREELVSFEEDVLFPD